MMLTSDVTASNIMLGHDGRARLIDLGIARSRENRAERTDAGSVRGTLRYLAPELFGTADHSPQTDLWSLGVVLWESLIGREALQGPSAACIGRIRLPPFGERGCRGLTLGWLEHAQLELQDGRLVLGEAPQQARQRLAVGMIDGSIRLVDDGVALALHHVRPR